MAATRGGKGCSLCIEIAFKYIRGRDTAATSLLTINAWSTYSHELSELISSEDLQNLPVVKEDAVGLY